MRLYTDLFSLCCWAISVVLLKLCFQISVVMPKEKTRAKPKDKLKGSRLIFQKRDRTSIQANVFDNRKQRERAIAGKHMNLKTVDLPMEKIESFCQRWCITELALFGSVLRDDFRPDSDIDVLVTFSPTAQRGLSETVQMKDELQQILGREVDFIVKQAIERSENWLRRKNILESAQVIYASQ